MAIHKWPLGDGTTLEFTIYRLNRKRPKSPGLYIFSCIDGKRPIPLLIGQADDLSSDLLSKELSDSIYRNGATHIHALTVTQPSMRVRWRKMLIEHHDPPLNPKPYPMIPPKFGTW